MKKIRFTFDETSKVAGDFCIDCALYELEVNTRELRQRTERSRRIREDLDFRSRFPKHEGEPKPCSKHSRKEPA